VLGTGWSAIVAAGALAGDRLPDVGLELAAPLCFVAIVVPRLRDVSHRWAAGAGGAVAAVTAAWPAGTGTAAAVAAGCVAAQVVSSRRDDGMVMP
jgi:predicted branched-subunit amino acid permease